MKKITVLIAGLLSFSLCNCQTKSPFPLTDLHVHCKGGFTIEDAVKKSKAENIRYGLVTNVGIGFPVHSDSQIDSVINSLKNYPQFFIGMQAEGREDRTATNTATGKTCRCARSQQCLGGTAANRV